MGEKRLKAGKILLLSVKIAIGASLAIYIAEYLQLEYAASAGIITLLSVLTTKWGTLKLSLLRILTFLITAAGCWLILQYVRGDWIGFGIFLADSSVRPGRLDRIWNFSFFHGRAL